MQKTVPFNQGRRDFLKTTVFATLGLMVGANFTGCGKSRWEKIKGIFSPAEITVLEKIPQKLENLCREPNTASDVKDAFSSKGTSLERVVETLLGNQNMVPNRLPIGKDGREKYFGKVDNFYGERIGALSGKQTKNSDILRRYEKLTVAEKKDERLRLIRVREVLKASIDVFCESELGQTLLDKINKGM